MSEHRLFSIRNPWFTASVGLAIGFATLGAIVGMVVLPYAQHDLALRSLWDAICSAAGVPHVSPTASLPPTFKTSGVVVTSRMLSDPSAVSIGRGATLALQCAICHGPNGFQKANSPDLAGQYVGVIYKELEDFKSGARGSAVMAPFSFALSEQDMLDLAAYYSYLPRVSGTRSGDATPSPGIVANGAPMRNIAPCASCHGAGANKAGSPWLEGQPVAYLKAQLEAFATGARRNDISEQMRNVARNMTPHEIDRATRHYAEGP